jgi:hypothetical protein
MTERTYKDYEELAQLLEDAETAVARVQGKLIDMFPVEAVDEGYRLPAPSRYDEMALHATLKLTKLRYGAPPRVPQRVPESEVPPGKPRTPRPLERGPT